jgi:hypothetical protein
MKIRPVGAELLHSDGRTNIRTDRHEKANNAFRNFGSENKKHNKKNPAKEFYVFVILNCSKKGIYLTLSESVQGFSVTSLYCFKNQRQRATREPC